jgi:lipoprotein-anchoring transpeptidase ErfK/SrfK
MERADGKTTRRTQPGRIPVLVTALALAIPSLAQISLAQAPDKAASQRIKRVVLISIPDRKLAVIERDIEGEKVIARFPVAVGAAASPSPTGKFQIVSRVSNPTYYRPGTVIPTGKDNPVGTRWLGISQKGYGIHGTNAPKSVGRASSHGCIRLRNRDMERLFAMLRVGDAVEIRGERDEQVAQIFGNGAEETTVASAELPTEEGGQ